MHLPTCNRIYKQVDVDLRYTLPVAIVSKKNILFIFLTKYNLKLLFDAGSFYNRTFYKVKNHSKKPRKTENLIFKTLLWLSA